MTKPIAIISNSAAGFVHPSDPALRIAQVSVVGADGQPAGQVGILAPAFSAGVNGGSKLNLPNGGAYPLEPRGASNEVIQIAPGGRLGTYDNTNQSVFQYTAELPLKAFGAAPIIPELHGDAAVTILGCTVSVLTDLSTDAKINNSDGIWSPVTVSSDPAFTLENSPVGGAITSRPAYTVPDYTLISPQPRTDDQSKPAALSFRIYPESNATLTVSGNGEDFTWWANRTDGKRVIMRRQAGDILNTPAAFNSVVNVSQCPIIGIKWLIANPGKSIGYFGDSIFDGRVTGKLGDSYVSKAIKMLNDLGLQVTAANFAWSGQGAAGPVGFHARVLDVLDSDVCPTIFIVEGGSLNDVLSSAIIQQWKKGVTSIIAKAKSKGRVVLFTTVMATSYAAHPNGANDQLRIDFNSWLLSEVAGQGIRVVDVATPMDGDVEQHGQRELNTEFTDDRVHPNLPGDWILTNVLFPYLLETYQA